MGLEGVSFPTESTSAAARTILSDALRKADPVGARAVENETNWRRNYLDHFRRALEAGIGEATAAQSIASDGLQSAHELMRFGDVPLDDAITGTALSQVFHTRTINGAAEPETELSIPYRGERLRGQALLEQLNTWVGQGVITQSCSEAIQTVQDNPEWLRLEGDTVVALGAGAEMAPYRALLRWGAEVVAIDLPRPDMQERVRAYAEDSASRVHLPARIVTNGDDDSGADLVTELSAVAHWLEGFEGRLVLGNYPPGADPGVCDALVPQQGPNYALAKRLQRWRATAARHEGTTVSLNVAPATRTRSVVKNKALAAAYAGAHRFGVEVFEPATSNTLMAALMAYDLKSGAAPQAEPWQDEAINAAHGGLWTSAYHPRSALGLAAVLGVGALRG